MKQGYGLIKFFLIGLLLKSALFQAQQYQLSGTVQNLKGISVPFVEVSLHNPVDSLQIRGTLTDEDGKFFLKVEAGKFLLSVQSPGTTPLWKDIEVTRDNDLGILKPEAEHMDLGTVVVTGQKPLIERKADKVVLNVAGNKFLEGKNTLQILDYAPGVRIDQINEKIKMKDQTALVMIDGQRTYMNGKDLMSYLNGLPKDAVKSVEIISNPSAKYEAQSGGGIINIITDKKSRRGFNGNFLSQYTQGQLPRHDTSLMLDARLSEKLSFSVMGGYEQNGFLRKDSDMEKLPLLNIGYDSFRRDKQYMKRKQFQLKSLYEINKKHSIGMEVTLFRSDRKHHAQNNIIKRAGQNCTNLSNESRSYPIYTYYRGGIQYAYKPDSSDRKLEVGANIFSMDRREKDFYVNRYDDPRQSNQLRSYAPGRYRIYSGQVDYTRPLSWAKLEIGAKYSLVHSVNRTDFEKSANGQFQFDPGRSNAFNYDEQISAAYVSLSAEDLFHTGIEAKGGLRTEYTSGKGFSPKIRQGQRREYRDFFPSLSLSKSFEKKHSVSFSYSRKINRPAYESLNPTVYYFTDYLSSIGNPDLKPEYINVGELSYSYGKNYNLSLFYNDSKQRSIEVVESLGEGLLQHQRRNMDRARTWGLYLNTQHRLTKWWTVLTKAEFFRQDYRSKDIINRTNNVFFGKLTQQFVLPKEYKLEFSGLYNSAEIFGQFQLGAVVTR